MGMGFGKLFLFIFSFLFTIDQDWEESNESTQVKKPSLEVESRMRITQDNDEGLSKHRAATNSGSERWARQDGLGQGRLLQIQLALNPKDKQKQTFYF